MKRRKPQVSWGSVKWTPFEKGPIPTTLPEDQRPHEFWKNSVYQVQIWFEHSEFFKDHLAHLCITTLDQQARHDWREMQRVKNEICGKEAEGFELFSAESRLVDSNNEYHLYVLHKVKLPVGMKTRLVAESAPGDAAERQRDFPKDARPPDLARRPKRFG